MRVLLGLFAIVIIAAASACSGYDIPKSRLLGVFNVSDTSNGAGGYVVKPTAVFWNASNSVLPYSVNVADSCIDALYVAPDTGHAMLTGQLDAGSPITYQTDLAVGSMTPDTVPGLITYRQHGSGVLHTPGANITFTIPGAAGGFPASAQTAITAKRLVLGPIDPNPPDSLHLTWLIGQPGLAAVNIYLIYTTTGTSPKTRQIICNLYDDGDAWVPKKTLTGWKVGSTTTPGQRVRAFRWITTYSNAPNNSLLLTISEFDTLKTTLP